MEVGSRIRGSSVTEYFNAGVMLGKETVNCFGRKYRWKIFFVTVFETGQGVPLRGLYGPLDLLFCTLTTINV